jgi:hypothetical protein
MLNPALTVRAATPHDADTLRRLAALDNRRQPHGHTLLAEHDGVALAAIALSSGLTAADPRTDTSHAVHLLKHRRYRLLRQGGDVGYARALLRRPAPSIAAAS